MKTNLSFPNIINASKSKTSKNIYFNTINISIRPCSQSSSFAFTFNLINQCYIHIIEEIDSVSNFTGR